MKPKRAAREAQRCIARQISAVLRSPAEVAEFARLKGSNATTTMSIAGEILSSDNTEGGSR